MDLIILFVLVVIVCFVYRDVKFVVYLLGILEIFFGIVHYLGDNFVLSFNDFINKNIPPSIFSLIDKYTSGFVNDVLSFLFLFMMGMFLFYLVRYFFRRK